MGEVFAGGEFVGLFDGCSVQLLGLQEGKEAFDPDTAFDPVDAVLEYSFGVSGLFQHPGDPTLHLPTDNLPQLHEAPLDHPDQAPLGLFDDLGSLLHRLAGSFLQPNLNVSGSSYHRIHALLKLGDDPHPPLIIQLDESLRIDQVALVVVDVVVEAAGA